MIRTIAYGIVLLCLLCRFPAFAEQEAPEDDKAARAAWILSEMEAHYARAEERFLEETDEEDYTANCGYCAAYQLQELGIFRKLHSVNGDASYYEFLNLQPDTPYTMRLWKGKRKAGEYNVAKVCRDLEAENPDGEMTCALLTFKVGADNNKGWNYGHVLLIYSVYDGMVYWGETDGTHVDTIDSFAAFYRETDRQYHFNGAFVYRIPKE